MNANTIKLYRAFRKAGNRADESLRSARTVERFKTLEADELVKIEAIPDEFYDVTGQSDDDATQAQIEIDYARTGAYGVVGSWFDGHEWRFADSVWGFVGYNNPRDPIENAYAVDVMQLTIDAMEKADRCPCCGRVKLATVAA